MPYLKKCKSCESVSNNLDVRRVMNVKWLLSESLEHFPAAATPSKPAVGPTKTDTDIRG